MKQKPNLEKKDKLLVFKYMHRNIYKIGKWDEFCFDKIYNMF